MIAVGFELLGVPLGGPRVWFVASTATGGGSRVGAEVVGAED